MSISGSGSGTPGGIPEFPLISDQTAAALTARTAMGIVGNLDKLMFYQVGEQTQWKYDTSSSKPALHPLEHMRVDVSPPRKDNEWKQILAEIMDDLPRDVRAAYEQSLRLPPEERLPSLIALGKILEGTAKALSWINNSARQLDSNNPLSGPGSEVEARRIINQQLADKVTQGILNDSQATLFAVQKELLNIGSNHPQFDGLMGALNQVAAAYTTLIDVYNPSVPDSLSDTSTSG